MTTTADTRMAWEAVADRLSALGLKLKVHFEQAGPGQQPATRVNEAFQQLGAAIESTFSAVGAAIQDPAVREDANDLAEALGNALANTLSEAGQEVAAAADALRCQHGSADGAAAEQTTDKK